MLAAYHKCHQKMETLVKLKETLQSIWDSVPEEPDRQGCEGI